MGVEQLPGSRCGFWSGSDNTVNEPIHACRHILHLVQQAIVSTQQLVDPCICVQLLSPRAHSSCWCTVVLSIRPAVHVSNWLQHVRRHPRLVYHLPVAGSQRLVHELQGLSMPSMAKISRSSRSWKSTSSSPSINCTRFMSSLAWAPMFALAMSPSYLIGLKNSRTHPLSPCLKFLNSALAADCVWKGIILWSSSPKIRPKNELGKPSTSSLKCTGILVNSSSAQLVRKVGNTILACSSSHLLASVINANQTSSGSSQRGIDQVGLSQSQTHPFDGLGLLLRSLQPLPSTKLLHRPLSVVKL